MNPYNRLAAKRQANQEIDKIDYEEIFNLKMDKLLKRITTEEDDGLHLPIKSNHHQAA